jgi:hypothetical protein
LLGGRLRQFIRSYDAANPVAFDEACQEITPQAPVRFAVGGQTVGSLVEYAEGSSLFYCFEIPLCHQSNMATFIHSASMFVASDV